MSWGISTGFSLPNGGGDLGKKKEALWRRIITNKYGVNKCGRVQSQFLGTSH